MHGMHRLSCASSAGTAPLAQLLHVIPFLAPLRPPLKLSARPPLACSSPLHLWLDAGQGRLHRNAGRPCRSQARAFHAAASSSSSLSGAARGSAIAAATSRSVICAAVRAWYSRCQPSTRPPSSAATAGGGGSLRFCACGTSAQQQCSARHMLHMRVPKPVSVTCDPILLHACATRSQRQHWPACTHNKCLARIFVPRVWKPRQGGDSVAIRALIAWDSDQEYPVTLRYPCSSCRQVPWGPVPGARSGRGLAAHPCSPGAVQPPAGHEAPGSAPAGQRRKDAVRGPPVRKAEQVHALPALRRRAEKVHVLHAGHAPYVRVGNAESFTQHDMCAERGALHAGCHRFSGPARTPAPAILQAQCNMSSQGTVYKKKSHG